jgi:hypothetical protein
MHGTRTRIPILALRSSIPTASGLPVPLAALNRLEHASIAYRCQPGAPPEQAPGSNKGANPGEFLLHALAGCITTTTVLHATARGIRIDSTSTELSGDIDLQACSISTLRWPPVTGRSR